MFDHASTILIRLDTSGALEGMIELPPHCPPYPVALFHAGSGPTDRNGNSPALRNDSLKLLAEALAARGIASVRYDKPGVAASATAAPASARAPLVHLRRRRPAVARLSDPGRSFQPSDCCWSQRGESDRNARGRGELGCAVRFHREQLARQLSGALLTSANEIIAELEAGREVPSVPQALAPYFHPSVQPYLIDWFRQDPAGIIRRLEHTPLLVQGTTDLELGVQDAELLHAARPDSELVLVEGMNHVFRQATGGIEAQITSSRDPALPLHPALVEPIAAFILKAR